MKKIKAPDKQSSNLFPLVRDLLAILGFLILAWYISNITFQYFHWLNGLDYRLHRLEYKESLNIKSQYNMLI